MTNIATCMLYIARAYIVILLLKHKVSSRKYINGNYPSAWHRCNSTISGSTWHLTYQPWNVSTHNTTANKKVDSPFV